MQTPDMSDGMADLMLYKFKKYLGSVSREIQNRRLKMGAYETDGMYNMPVVNRAFPIYLVDPKPPTVEEVYTKDEVIALLKEIQNKMEAYEPTWAVNDDQAAASCRTWEDLDKILQEEINVLRGDK